MDVLGNQFLTYPFQAAEECYEGIFPVDFILEDIIKGGLEWFRNTEGAPGQVFGQLKAPWLQARYGEGKITEIANFIKKYQIEVVQHFSLIHKVNPTISILLSQADEEESRAGLDDFQRQVDTINQVTESVEGRVTYGYIPITDNIQIGIHSINTPDLTKYLYYLVIYLLNVFKMELQERGMILTTFRASDISRMDEKLPENMYNRYIYFSTFTTASFVKNKVPILKDIFLNIDYADTNTESDGG